MFGVPVEKHGINSHLRQKGKIAELALGYGGSVGALKSMGALEIGLTEEELQPLVDSWRASNPMITAFWWDVDTAVKTTIKQRIPTEVRGIHFFYKSGMLFIKLPSGRLLSYVKPKIGENKFGGESVTYEGIGSTKKWERIESYGPKFVENIVQAVSRDFSVLPCVTSPTALSAVMSMMSLSSNVAQTQITNPSVISWEDPRTGCLISRLEAMDMKRHFTKKIKKIAVSGVRQRPLLSYSYITLFVVFYNSHSICR